MIRGTTPTIKYNIGLDASTVVDCRISFKQFNKDLFLKTYDDVSFENTTISLMLTQEETLSFSAGKLFTQIRVKTQDGKVYASKMIELSVHDSLCCEIM